MSDTVIRVENLGKKYIIGHQKQERYTALRDVLEERISIQGRVTSLLKVETEVIFLGKLFRKCHKF